MINSRQAPLFPKYMKHIQKPVQFGRDRNKIRFESVGVCWSMDILVEQTDIPVTLEVFLIKFIF